MKTFPSRLVSLTRFLLLLVFSYTASVKLLRMDHFANTLYGAYELRPFIHLLVWLVPVTEVVIVGLLIFPATQRLGYLASGTLLLLFTGYIGWMLLFSDQLPCSCGGIISQLGWTQHLALNALLSGGAFYSYQQVRRHPASPPIFLLQ